MAGCVTERPPPRGVPVRPQANSGPASSTTAPPVEVPQGPVARPATGVTVNSAVRVAFYPLGSAVYDGQTLPLASPDGRFVAVQSGEAPDWPAILAEPAAAPTNRTTITAFDASGSKIEPIRTPEATPAGLMLGRAADDGGYLVESQQRDGTRWIGKVAWLSGRVEWLAKDEFCNSHAVLTPGGGVLYCRRPIGGQSNSLVLLAGGQVSKLDPGEGETYAFPMAGDDAGVVYACRITKGGTELEAIRVQEGVLKQTIMRRLLGGSSDILLAHQVAATASQPSFLPPQTRAEPRPLSLLWPRRGSLAVFNLSEGTFEPLAPRSIAAAPSPDPLSPGYFCTTPDGLVFVPKVGLGGPLGQVVTMISTAYVPRAVVSDPPGLLLVGPAPGSPDRLEVVRMNLRPGEAR
jgi:hypothetical protein